MSSARDIYVAVVNDVIKHIKPLLADEGIPEDVADEIMRTWQEKIDNTKVTLPIIPDEGGHIYDDGEPSYPASQADLYAYRIPQQDGASDAAFADASAQRRVAPVELVAQVRADGVSVAPAPARPARPPRVGQFDGKSDPDDLDDEEIRSEDDDDEDSDLDNMDNLSAENHVLCQFEKVNRNKTKWKVSLRDGVMHLEGSDQLFHKAIGEFDF